MTSDVEKNKLIEQFQSYLEQSSVESVIANEQPDLHTLLIEMAGLKTEVKAESRQFKNTLDTLSSALETIQTENKHLAESMLELKQQQSKEERAMLLELVEIYDRLNTGTDILKNYRPVKSIFKSSRKQDIKFIKSFHKGQTMSLGRFDQLFQRYQMSVIDCMGKKFDPTLMIAAETSNDQQIETGIVLEVLREGFLYKNEVLRLAEVKVNK